jgi:hypothetical protein
MVSTIEDFCHFIENIGGAGRGALYRKAVHRLDFRLFLLSAQKIK